MRVRRFHLLSCRGGRVEMSFWRMGAQVERRWVSWEGVVGSLEMEGGREEGVRRTRL